MRQTSFGNLYLCRFSKGIKALNKFQERMFTTVKIKSKKAGTLKNVAK
jgi:hypothetical protein